MFMSGSIFLHLIYGFKRDEIPGSPHPDDDLGIEWHEAGVMDIDEYRTEFAGVELCGELEGMSEEYTDTSIDFPEWDRMKKEFDQKLIEKGITVQPRVYMYYYVD